MKNSRRLFFFTPITLNSFYFSVLFKKFFYSFLLPSFTFFIPSSCLLLFILLIFVKIPSYLASDLSLFLLPSFLSFSIPLFPPSIFFSCPHCSFSHRWDNKTWSAEKTRVRLCYTHKRQLKTSEHRRLRRQHHWIPLAFYHRSSYHKSRESEYIILRSRG